MYKAVDQGNAGLSTRENRSGGVRGAGFFSRGDGRRFGPAIGRLAGRMVTLDSQNSRIAPSGIYFYRLLAADLSLVRKMVLVK